MIRLVFDLTPQKNLTSDSKLFGCKSGNKLSAITNKSNEVNRTHQCLRYSWKGFRSSKYWVEQGLGNADPENSTQGLKRNNRRTGNA